MARFQEFIDVMSDAQSCYEQWVCFEDFPRFMKHVRSVTPVGKSTMWHWVVDGPLGKKVEWDAVMDSNEPNRIISWHSVGENDIGAEGVVTFQEVAPNLTRITSSIMFEAPASPLGEMIAGIFSNPSQMVKEDLRSFKELMESNQFAIRSSAAPLLY
jgi:uncharacterized membrane protein